MVETAVMTKQYIPGLNRKPPGQGGSKIVIKCSKNTTVRITTTSYPMPCKAYKCFHADKVKQLVKEAEVLSKQCLTCDNPNCDNKNPKKICSQCKASYYCSKECQISHWKGVTSDHDGKVYAHKIFCMATDYQKSSAIYKSFRDKAVQWDVLYKQPQMCVICHEIAEDPIRTNLCGHNICWDCIDYWDDLEGKGQEDPNWHWSYNCGCGNKKSETDVRNQLIEMSDDLVR